MSTSLLNRGTGRIAYDVQGEGPLVVCLPGMGDLRSVYRFTIGPLVAAGFRVATMDLRGHGDSDDTFDSFDDVAAAQDALALINHLGGGPAVIVGNSMSAGAAVWAAAESPRGVNGLVLIGPFVRNPETTALKRWALRLLLAKPWGPSVWLHHYAGSYPSSPPADLDNHVQRIRTSLRRGQHWRSFIATTHTDHEPARQRLAAVRAATLVIMGSEDPDWPDARLEARYVAESLGGTLLMVEGCGHYPMAEEPDVTNPSIIDFVRRVTEDA